MINARGILVVCLVAFAFMAAGAAQRTGKTQLAGLEQVR
jgi:hypothetical protein